LRKHIEQFQHLPDVLDEGGTGMGIETLVSLKTLEQVIPTENWTNWFGPSVLPNLCLAVVGIVAIGVAICTLRTIDRQTKATENAANAAKASADGLINSERAWVLIEIGQKPDFRPDPNEAQILWISPTIKNYGKTPARIRKIVARAQLVPDGQALPPQPEYPIGQSAILSVDVVLPPNVPIQPTASPVSRQEFIQVQQGNIFLYVHGFVDYLDFSGTKRHSGFCYFYYVEVAFSPSPTGFYAELTAPPAYTECI
jgi:hypothetical protein